MGEQTFNCDRCGRETPERQLKEAFISETGDPNERVKKNLCPGCLDEVMNTSGDVRGVPGEDKRAAVAINQGADADPIRHD